MSQQNPLTLVTPIKPEKLAALYKVLSNMKYRLEKGEHELFEKNNNIHYLRWLVIDDKNTVFFNETKRNPKLVFSSNFDGKVLAHITDLSSDMDHQLIDEIYSCCIGYPEPKDCTPKTRAVFFKKHMIKVSAFYKGSPGRSLKQIREEQDLRMYLRKKLDTENWKGLTAQQIHQQLKKETRANAAFSILNTKYSMPKTNWFKFALLVIVLLALLPLIIVWILIVEFAYERKDQHYTKTRSDLNADKIKILEEYEDLTSGEDLSKEEQSVAGVLVKDKVINYQNQFSQLVEMKEGTVRLITFKAMMLFAKTLIPIKFVKGELMGIPTIHFARWVLFDDNKRVLFFSNFDGSWQQYLGDFIDQSGWGLTGIFSNTKVFPKTRFLLTGGAYDEEHFLAWSRDSELPTQIWYSAYPSLSIKNVNNNSQIRVLFSKNLNNKKAKKLFELI
ncbi:hypothetical protein KO494_09040 [Lacinutrix sp. C3R15]|uniref:hypothetical protein n=1 Tax=Flavobacteriaceae TaxID=49546 RepID=UPI001C09DEA8|nr:MULTISPECIES: hypothetical protein [Flavobacteriaceae]MBU2939682.1 hypothetical protein [Lacinutrix sp. C3R15]MDO6622997.1 hypothetical protein [Oceanihabitans sp. 1_MG-2023]